ncbi:glycosyltransferase [Actinomadura violacea]|uniref:Glycosyltransferase n=1 Tax=Actinomadura violacea TaxID=2819934 RepID=A0ABS3RMT9_9ACTN|nr:glycosyltransferase [Actinomadura violacea]MBO2458056.1 glycosyltransferase [Actinomadura violacea]
MPSGKQTICLTMIVKNEAHVIARCLASVRPLITSWCIVDTGSGDGTQKIIREELADLPGQLHERPWRDFGHNRTEAIELARGKADYDLVIDADDVLVIPGGFAMPRLTADSYEIRVEDCGTSYYRVHLFRGDLDFHYVGVLHEVIMSGPGRSLARLDGLGYRRMYDGARSTDPLKFRKDAALLEKSLKAEPGNTRYAFYLAQSWRDAGEYTKAAAAYERRAGMGGWPEEVWYSLYERARLAEHIGEDDDAVIAHYVRAFETRPQRAEAPCHLARALRLRNRPAAAYPFARTASDIPRPNDILFIDDSVYTWRALDEFGIAAYHTGLYREGLAANAVIDRGVVEDCLIASIGPPRSGLQS